MADERSRYHMMSSADLPPIVIGPQVELHTGVHGSLMAHPPTGVNYVVGSATHFYGHDDLRQWSPFEHPAIDEAVRLRPPKGGWHLVHTSRVPATGEVPWLADADCLLVTLLWGRDLVFGQGEKVKDAITPAQSIARQRNLLKRYLDSSCYGVLFRTDFWRQHTLNHVADNGLVVDVEAFAAKTTVVPPAVPPEKPKPRVNRRFTVLYMGRDGAAKGSKITAAVFCSLAARFGGQINLWWIGEPTAEPLPPSVEVSELFERTEYLRVLDDVDVFFSPTTTESFGMGLIEAGAHGAVVVTTRGSGMGHIEEIFTDGYDALLVDASIAPHKLVGRFIEIIASLLANPSKACVMGNRARAKAADRLVRRDLMLLDHYNEMASASPGQLLPIAGAFNNKIDGGILAAEYQRRLAGRSRNVYVEGDPI